MFHVKHYAYKSVSIAMYVQYNSNETRTTSYEASESVAKSDENRSVGVVAEESAVPAGRLGWHVQASEKAGDAAAGRRCAGVVSTGRAGVPDANQPGSAEGRGGGEEESAGVTGMFRRESQDWCRHGTRGLEKRDTWAALDDCPRFWDGCFSNQNNSIGAVGPDAEASRASRVSSGAPRFSASTT